MVTEHGYSKAEAGRSLDVNPNQIRRWQLEFEADGSDAFPGQGKLTPDQNFGPGMSCSPAIGARIPSWSEFGCKPKSNQALAATNSRLTENDAFPGQGKLTPGSEIIKLDSGLGV